MDKVQIQKNIDRVIGTEGNLQVPSWWMHKILSDLVKYCGESTTESDKEYIESQLNLLREELSNKSNYTVNNIEELGALDVPLGTVASVVKEGHEVTQEFSQELIGLHVKDIIINTENIQNIDIDAYDDSGYEIGLQYKDGGHPSIDIRYSIEEGEKLCILYWCHYTVPLITIYKDGFEIHEENMNKMKDVLTSYSCFFDAIRYDSSLASTFNKLVQGVFVCPSEVDTYIKTEKGLDLPTTIYRKFSDFGEQPELFPKEERVVKNFDIIGEVIQSGNVRFETIGGTSITIIGYKGTGWEIQYNDSEYMPLDDIELQKFKDLVNSTTVYYVDRSGASGFTASIDSMISAEFPPIYKTVELTTWSKIYTKQDALTDSEIDSIMNEVFGGGYYYYGDNGIGEFDLDEEQISEETEPVNIENDETNSQP